MTLPSRNPTRKKIMKKRPEDHLREHLKAGGELKFLHWQEPRAVYFFHVRHPWVYIFAWDRKLAFVSEANLEASKAFLREQFPEIPPGEPVTCLAQIPFETCVRLKMLDTSLYDKDRT